MAVHTPHIQENQSATDTGEAAAHSDGISATPGETTGADTLPDLSRLSLGGGQPASAAPTASLSIAVHAYGTPVTINILHGETREPAQSAARTDAHRDVQVLRLAPHGPPPASPARFQLLPPAVGVPVAPGAGPDIVAAHPVAPAATAPTPATDVAPAPAAPAPTATAAPAPAAEAAAAAAPAAPAPAAPAPEDYEYIAPRDPTHTRWYVVTAGRRVGIWREWVDMSHHVIRVPGNMHKLFDTRAEAEAHYYANKAMGAVQIILP